MSHRIALLAVRAGQLGAVAILLAFGRSTTSLFFTAAAWPWVAGLAGAGMLIFTGAHAIRHALWKSQGVAVIALSVLAVFGHGRPHGRAIAMAGDILASVLMVVIVATMFLRPLPQAAGSRRTRRRRHVREG